ncbi:MAG: hypothetical protein K2H64_03435 [Desulfovibrio sp.]|nr:hypothetical protein [Desulfovibrio sp.]
MKREEFIKCRNEILSVLKKYNAEDWTPIRILTSAINDIANERGYQVKLTFFVLPDFGGDDDKN